MRGKGVWIQVLSSSFGDGGRFTFPNPVSRWWSPVGCQVSQLQPPCNLHARLRNSSSHSWLPASGNPTMAVARGGGSGGGWHAACPQAPTGYKHRDGDLRAARWSFNLVRHLGGHSHNDGGRAGDRRACGSSPHQVVAMPLVPGGLGVRTSGRLG
jgi:hypothetical protein